MLIDKKLSNGVRLVGHPMPYFKSVSVGIWVCTGSVKEQVGQEGLSHFIEHMLFKGTEKRDTAQIAKEMDAIGAQINAFTAKEYTCFYIRATDDRLEECVEMLSDIVFHSLLDEEEIQKEKGVVLEEILMIEDSPEELAMELLSETYYHHHPLSKPILGTKESVSTFKRSDLNQYLDDHYQADNIVLCVAGNFDEARMTEFAEKHIEISFSGNSCDYPTPPDLFGKRISYREKDIEQVQICMASPGFGARDPLYYPLLVLNNAIGGNMSSRIFQTIREEKGLAYSVYSFPTSYRDDGTFNFYAGTNTNTALEVIGLILEEIRNVRKKGITNEEFERSKSQLKGSFVLSNESVSSRMMSLGKNILLYGNARSEEEILEILQNVSMDDINKILPIVLNEEYLCATFVGRVKDEIDQYSKLW